MTRNTILTVALVASLLMVGFAGTAAASGTADTAGEAAGLGDEDTSTDDNQVAAAAVVQDQTVTQLNDIDQNASQNVEQNATGIDIGIGIGDDDTDSDNIPALGDQLEQQNANDNNDDDGFNLEIGTTGDQTVNQNISQNADASNSNAQVGTATATNYDFDDFEF
ncbi:hypothetical protein C478_08808 [Natrinema thermotolerans DSM 11552]|nr:hypothetical protein C478_08808 [Natrinema thermotolerans DSM 11552]